jgi:NAD(P)-dependent dehydrogenase (short-subunit alcohol dehydrogenase family)
MRLGHGGARVFIGDINPSSLEEALSAFKSDGIEASGGMFDASKAADAQRFFSAVVKRYSRLDVLVNNAGAIINIASVAGIQGGMTLSPPYAGAKAALINLTKVAATRLAQYGITANAVAPGIVNTALNWKLDEEIGQKKPGMAPGQHFESRWKPRRSGAPQSRRTSRTSSPSWRTRTRTASLARPSSLQAGW